MQSRSTSRKGRKKKSSLATPKDWAQVSTFSQMESTKMGLPNSDREPLNWSPERLAAERQAAEVRAQMLFRFVAPVVMGDVRSSTTPINSGSGVVIRLPKGL